MPDAGTPDAGTPDAGTPDAGQLTGRRVLVTGASKGIGAAIVRALHREGASVALHYNSDRTAAEALAAELEGAGGAGSGPSAETRADGPRSSAEAAAGDASRVHLVAADLSRPDAADRLWDDASAVLGGIDVLVNNAGAWAPSPLESADDWSSGWAANMQLNLTSAADLCRKALLAFGATGSRAAAGGAGPSGRLGGIIITMTSRSAHRGDDADHLAYGAAKAGLLALTKGIARGYGHLGVLAYAIAPGWVDTGLAAGAIDEATLAGLPLREVTPPSDIAELVAFLAGGRSRHLTGATLDVTGADYVR